MLKGFDKYSNGVTLSYRHSGSFPTSIGGICSIISWIILTWWFATEIYSNYINPSYTTTLATTLVQRDNGTYPVYKFEHDELIITYNITSTNIMIRDEDLASYFTPLWIQTNYDKDQ